MKKLILFAFVLCNSAMFCQTRNMQASIHSVNSKDDFKNNFSWVSPNRDTLYLLKIEIGYMVKKMWDSEANKPVIIMTNNLPKRPGSKK